jgi:branched-chain amino acid transport system ATP-binding protein
MRPLDSASMTTPGCSGGDRGVVGDRRGDVMGDIEQVGRSVRVCEIDPGMAEDRVLDCQFGADTERASKVYEGVTHLDVRIAVLGGRPSGWSGISNTGVDKLDGVVYRRKRQSRDNQETIKGGCSGADGVNQQTELSDPILRVDEARVCYRNRALGTLNVSFSAWPGQVVAIFGPNGAGKTSSVRAASGFLRSEGTRLIKGRVAVGGIDVTNCEPHRHAKLGVFFVPERNKVFANLTVAENLFAIGRLPKRERRKERLEFIYALFPILGERRRQQGGRLSGGQRQMLALARGILSDPKVLIVDEMTLGLHHSVQPTLFDAVRRVAASGTAVVLVDESTHFALDVADYCYVLAAGEVRDEGPASKFRDNELLVAGYVDARP